MARQAVAARGVQPLAAAALVQSEAVDDGQESPAEPALEHLVEDGEGVRAGALIVLALPHEGPQRIRRDDLTRTELLRCPR
jgi:hypothetical protein